MKKKPLGADAAAGGTDTTVATPEPQASDETNERIVASLQMHRWKLSLEAIARAQALAWNDLPMNERRTYMAAAEAALREEIKPS